MSCYLGSVDYEYATDKRKLHASIIKKMKINTTLLVLLFGVITILLSNTFCSNGDKPKQKISIQKELGVLLDTLNDEFQKIYNNGHLPGFALSIFTKDSIFYKKGFGYADIDRNQKYKCNTVQGIASISKTLIAVCLMKAVEQDFISLDQDINDILPFKVINPHYKDSPITIRQLATHTSSITDEGNYDKAYVFSATLQKSEFPEAWHKYLDIYNSNSHLSMQKFFYEIFSKSGKWSTDKNFLNQEPGTYFEYSNIGASLLAYCIELSSGREYKDYANEIVLKEFSMNRSGWSRSNVDTTNHIAYYNENYNIVPSYQCITYPDGGLFSTVDDMTIFMQEMVKGYYGEGKVLTQESYREMMKNQIPELNTPTGIIWDMDNDCCIGHGGNDFGIASMMFFNPKNGIGKVLFTNISIEKEVQSEAFYGIFNKMFKYDSEINEASK